MAEFRCRVSTVSPTIIERKSVQVGFTKTERIDFRPTRPGDKFILQFAKYDMGMLTEPMNWLEPNLMWTNQWNEFESMDTKSGFDTYDMPTPSPMIIYLASLTGKNVSVDLRIYGNSV